MSEIARSKTAEIPANERSAIKHIADKSIKIRVSPNNYFIALFLSTFFTALLLYLELDIYALSLSVASWIIIPFCIFTDKIVFDGKRLTRTGFIPKFWAWINNDTNTLTLDEIEQIETHALRALKRGGNVFYRYRTSIRGRSLQFIIASGGEEYRLMVRKLFALVSENVLDNRSMELRDYLSEPKETLMKAEFERIPAADVLEDSFDEKAFPKISGKKPDINKRAEDFEKIEYLRNLANELRLSGYLLQALETFRRALHLNPRDGWLLFEFYRISRAQNPNELEENSSKKFNEKSANYFT